MRICLMIVALLGICFPINAAEYYCILFCSENEGLINKPRYCHTWGTFLKTNNGNLEEELTISWSPVDNYQLGDGRVEGVNKPLQKSIKDAMWDKCKVYMWGPYLIKEDVYLKAKTRYKDLNEGKYYYKVLDANSRKRRKKPAVNCIHAVSEICGDFPTITKIGKPAMEKVTDKFKKTIVVDKCLSYDWILRKLALTPYFEGTEPKIIKCD